MLDLASSSTTNINSVPSDQVVNYPTATGPGAAGAPGPAPTPVSIESGLPTSGVETER